ncbi:MAG: AraC family transcriptional regulator [Clostridia bacterium]|nr:AraC family transcriptional regulator [Clostridia bacterium]
MIAFYENRTDDLHCRDNSAGNKHLRHAAHLHSHLELVIFLDGHATAFCDTERVDLQAGDVFLTFPNQIHRYESFEKECYYIFLINPEILPELSSVFLDSLPTSALLRGMAQDEEVLSLAKRLCDMDGDDSPFAKVKRNGYLLALLSKLLQHMELGDIIPGDSHALKTIVNFCARNFRKELSLSLLENELHISRYYISHLFSDKLKMSFNDYINSLRVSSACTYLKSDDKSVTEISSLVGFGTLRTFNRAFSKQMGQTPSEYRASKRKAHGALNKKGTQL